MPTQRKKIIYKFKRCNQHSFGKSVYSKLLYRFKGILPENRLVRKNLVVPILKNWHILPAIYITTTLNHNFKIIKKITFFYL